MDRRRLRDFDAGLLSATIVLAAVGIVMVYSATHDPEAAGLSALVRRQLLVAAIGFSVLAGMVAVSQDALEAFAPAFYGVVLLLLLAVLVFGVGSAGERRWFDFGALRFQPSEFAKIAVVLGLARYLARRRTVLERPLHLAVPVAIALVPAALVLIEPDLGSSLIIAVVLVPMLYWAGAPPSLIAALVTPVVSMILSFHVVAWVAYLTAVAWLLYTSRMFVIDKLTVLAANVITGRLAPLAWLGLEEYQRDRIRAFVRPEEYRLGIGYQLIQSRIAIGSGTLAGKGFLQGTQKNFAFLPEQHTDFIFAVLAEEFGFVGCLIVLAVYVFIAARMFRIAGQVRNRFAALVIVGIASTLFVQSAVNISVTLGMSPVTGMPLPLLSYGGSSLLVTLTSVGIVLGMGLRRMEY